MNMNQNNSFNSGNICKDCKDFICRILDTMTYFVKLVICSTVILYLINLIIPYVALLLADIPYFTIYYFQIWRLITTPFMTTNFFSVIFSLYFFYSSASKLEKETGTIKYMLIFFMNSIFIQILYIILMVLLSLIIQSKFPLKMKVTKAGVRNEGLWPILLCDITLLCLSNPNENMQFRFFPCVIKAKYYPLLLFLFFTIISGFQIDFENLCGIGFGFLYYYFLKNRISISNNFANKIGNSILCRWMKRKKGYIDIGGINVFNAVVSMERNVQINNRNEINNSNNSQSNRDNNNNNKGFKPFHGKGIAVGGGDNSISSDNKLEINKNASAEIVHTNVTANSTDDINSSDSRIDLNNSNNNPK